MLGYISLIILVFVVLLAAKFKKNPGIVGLGAAFILGFFVLNDNGVAISSVAGACKVMTGAFPTMMFLRIMCSAMLFSILAMNNTLNILTDKLLALAKGNQKIFPFILFFLNMLMSYAGVNTFTQLVIMTPICVSVAHRCGQNPFLLLLSTAIGARGGYTAKLNIMGIAVHGAAAANGFEMNGTEDLRMLIVSFITFALFYVVFKGYKLPRVEIESSAKEKLNKEQWISLICAIVCVVMTQLGFELSIVSAALTCVLLLITSADEKKVIASVPWGTIITICGMTMLLKVVEKAGGITQLIGFFESFMSPATVRPFFMIISALLSSVSSASGVVVPTLFPTIPGLASGFGVEPWVLALIVTVGSTATGIMPFSTVGATFLGLSTPEDNKDNYLFNHLIIASGVLLAVGLVCSVIGILG